MEFLPPKQTANDPLSRVAAISSLGRSRDLPDGAIDALVHALVDPSKQVRRLSAEILARTKRSDSRVLDALSATMSDSDEDVRRIAAEALGQIGVLEAGVVIALARAHTDPAVGVRDAATDALWLIAGPRPEVAIATLTPLLCSIVTSEGEAAATALAGIGRHVPDLVVREVVAAFDAENIAVRRRAAWTVAQLGRSSPQVVFSSLRALLTTGSRPVRRTAVTALASMPASVELASALHDALSDPDALVRCDAAGGLCLLGPLASAATPRLLQALRGGNRDLRRAATDALGSVPKVADSLPAILDALRDNDASVRAAAANLNYSLFFGMGILFG